MSILSLPKVGTRVLEFPHFPTLMQAFIFRNWDIVPKERIAKCLKCRVEQVEEQAEKMGLLPQDDLSVWEKRGYISIIKVNWHILPYNQLLELLDWDEEKLAFVLKEEDFLEFKLGESKPPCEQIVYRELTSEEETETERIKNVITEGFRGKEGKKPFEFFDKEDDGTVNCNICDDTGDSTVAFMAERYSRSLPNINKTVVLKFFDEEKTEEYHEIKIDDDKITVTASDSAGILRGLTYIEDRAKNNPHIENGTIKRMATFKTRFIYSFCSLYNDALDVDSHIYCPDRLLESYSRVGINGIWIQAVMYKLVEFPFAKELSAGWQDRLENLKRFAERSAKYGIKVYLYINEPRAMPIDFFDNHSDILGSVSKGLGCMCIGTSAVREYLSSGIKTICKAVPELGGFFTITVSENLTNCYSRVYETEELCPRCKNKEIYEVVSENIRIISDAIQSVNPKMKLFAWDWGWQRDGFMSSGDVKKCIERIPREVIMLCNRESGIQTDIGGVKGVVEDYTLAVDGISPCSHNVWQWASGSGHETAAKLQINNSWECSTIPYLPVFKFINKSVDDVKGEGVQHLMLSWTVGGFPSPNIKIVSEKFFKTEGERKENDLMELMYGENAELVKKATDILSDAFCEYPFNQQTIYFGPANSGASNLLFYTPTGFGATMTGFSYDDLERWRSIYPYEVFENQFRKMCDRWEEGLAILPEGELKDMAEATYIQLKSSHNQIRFVKARDNGNKQLMVDIASAEKHLAVRLYELMQKYPTIGFEAANHYYYTQGMLMEKAVNCQYICDKILSENQHLRT